MIDRANLIRINRRIARLVEEGKIPAQGTEARRAETTQIGSVHDGPVGKADAPVSGNTHSGDE